MTGEVTPRCSWNTTLVDKSLGGKFSSIKASHQVVSC